MYLGDLRWHAYTFMQRLPAALTSLYPEPHVSGCGGIFPALVLLAFSELCVLGAEGTSWGLVLLEYL